MDEATKEQIEKDIAALRDAAQGDDAEDIKKKMEALSQSSQKLGEAMYKAAQDAAEAEANVGGGDDGAAAGGNDDVVDADFEEIDDDENKKTGSA